MTDQLISQSICHRFNAPVNKSDVWVQVILDTIEYGAMIKKTPVVVGNCTGFAVNRVFFPYTQAACMLVDLGLDPYMIDMIILKGFGMPMGPFRSLPCPCMPPLTVPHGAGLHCNDCLDVRHLVFGQPFLLVIQ